MAGRGRGRGTFSRWDPGFDGRAIASVTPLKKRTSPTTNKVEGSKLSCVRVTCIIDVNHFWAQLGSSSDLEHYDNYMFALNHWCDNQGPSTISDMPNVGQVVCVQHAASRMWRRAEVTRLSQRMVDVFFLDYGEAECVSLDMLCSNVPSDITSWPPQALYCTLDGVHPPKGEDQWSEKAVKRFRELVSCGQNLAASHGNGSLQLTLYLINENGHMKSVGSILVEEGLAQDANYEPKADGVWPEVPQRSHQHKKENAQFKNLDQLKQELMCGISNLLNTSNEPKPDFAYETTTISSSYCTYKENKEPPTVTSSSNIQSFPAKDRGQQSHLSTTPHLASPGEFMTSAKVPFGKEQVSGFLQDDNHSRQAASTSIPGSESGSPHIPWFSSWSHHDWKLPRDQNKTPFGSNDIYSNDDQESLVTLAELSFHDSKPNASTLQYHLDGPSAFHDPKYKQEPLMGPFNNVGQSGDVFHSQPSPQQQHTQQQQQVKDSFANPQLPKSNCNEKTLTTEPRWQKWKFQRNVKKLLDKSQCEDINASDVGLEVGALIKNSKLSQNFEGVSEVVVVLEMITERVLEKTGFTGLAAKICSSLSGLEIPQFTRYMCEVITTIRDDLYEHQTISDWGERCERFCSFMGHMVAIAASKECTDTNFKSVIDVLISQSLEVWIALDKVTDIHMDVYLVGLIALLEVIGPVMEEHNLRFGRFDLETIFSIVRDHVLSQELPRLAKSALLDLMLLRAAGWPAKPQDVESDEDIEENVENENVDDVFLEKQEFEQDWDPYGKVYAMLEKLKLEDLFKKFKDNRIRDTLLVANKDEFKKTLQEAGFPPGVILEIQMFLERDEELPERKRSNSNKASHQLAKSTSYRKLSRGEPPNQGKLEKPVYQEQTRPPPRKSPDYQASKAVSDELDGRLERRPTKEIENEQLHHQPRDQAHELLRHQARDQTHEQAHYLKHDQTQEQLHHQARDHAREQLRQQSGDQANKQLRHQTRDQTQEPQRRQARDQAHEQLRHHTRDQTQEPSRHQARDQPHEQPHQVQEVLQHKVEERKLTAVTDQRRFTQENEENKTNIRDAHNLFVPSYLSRPPPLRMEPAAFEYDSEQESPSHEGPMSYSAVLKAKNEESFPEPPNKSMAVKFTALTKASTAESSAVQNKQQSAKTATKEAMKETAANRREPGPRPPPGLPPLPPQNWGHSPELRLTVLPNARRGKSEDTTMSPPEAEVWRGKQSFGSPPRPSVGRSGTIQGRQEGSRGLNRANNEWQGKHEPLNWRRLDNDFNKGTKEEQPIKPFGPGGQKACFTCGSKDHMSCNDRSKLFFD